MISGKIVTSLRTLPSFFPPPLMEILNHSGKNPFAQNIENK